MLAALRERFAQELLSKIKTAVAEKPGKDWKGKLAAWARAGVAGYLDSFGCTMLSFRDRPAKRKGSVNNIIIDHLSRMLQAGVEVGVVDRGFPVYRRLPV